MLRFAVVLLTVLTLPAAAQTTIRLGAWNIEHLGNRQNRSNQPRPVDLARYIIDSRVEVLGLEEITQDLEGRRNRILQRALDLVEQETGHRWQHLLFRKNGAHQHVGVAWNTTRVTLVQGPLRIDVPSSSQGISLWDRHPHAVKFSTGDGRTDFVVIVLHMKANTSDDNSVDVRRRALEARTLVDELAEVEVAVDDEDVVLIGDTNILDADERAAEIFTGAGFRDLNAEDEPTFNSANGAPFDRTFVPSQPEFQSVDQTVFDTEFLNGLGISAQTFRRRFSDHFMIFTDIRVLDDDD